MTTSPFTYSGLADEAGADIDTQIRAHQQLGWDHIELRKVGPAQFTDLSDAEFDAVCATLGEAGLRVSCFASAIANWACKITDPFEKSTDTLARAIPRMQRLGTRFIRIMSYKNDGLPEEEWRDEAVRRIREMAAMAEDGGIVLLVENCDGWASTSPETYPRFFEMVDSPAVKALYDTGNPASHGHTDTWAWYLAARPHLGCIHIKAHTGMPDGRHVWPDAGASKVEETLSDLIATGYRGFVSIEPHIKSVIHEGQESAGPQTAFDAYVEYGRRLVQLAERLRA